jgi:hypothetical protein
MSRTAALSDIATIVGMRCAVPTYRGSTDLRAVRISCGWFKAMRTLRLDASASALYDRALIFSRSLP